MTAHRAWRLSGPSPRGYGGAATIQMRGVPGGPDLTQGATGNAFESSYYSAEYNGAKAFDNNPATFWSSNGGASNYVGWDFGPGNAASIVEITYAARPDGYADADAFRPGSFQYSDDMVTWSTTRTLDPPSTYVAGTTYTFDVTPPPPLNPIVVGTQTVVQYAAVVMGANPAVTFPSNPTAGNVLLAMGSHYNNNPTVNAGWTQVYIDNGGSQDGTMVAYKVAGAGESNAQTPFTTGASGQSLVVLEIANANPPVIADHFNDNTTAALSLTGTAGQPAGNLYGFFSENQSIVDYTVVNATTLITATGTTASNSPRLIKGFGTTYDGTAKSVTAALGAAPHSSTGALVFMGVNGPTSGVQSSEARTFAIVKQVAANEQMSASRVFTIVTLASQRLDASAERFITVVKRNSIMEQSGSRVFAVVKGRTANPKLRAWTFTLDGHDFYVLRLGDDATLLYDVYSEQWIDWDSGGSPTWRANTGINWIGAQGLAQTFGSNVLVGDDEFGILWFLDPKLPWDENSALGSPSVEFERVVTGQVLASGRDYKPCYAIFIDGDNYGLTGASFTPTVYLETSDNQGRTFDQHEILTMTPDYSDNNPYAWYSLGQISSPGRMFRVRDNGLFARIDSMDMNDDAG